MKVDNPYIASWGALITYIREDWSVNDRSWTRPGMQAMAVHRFGVWRYSIRRRIFRAPLSLLYKICHVFVRNFYGIEINDTAIIGRRLRIAHQHGITMHRHAVLGDDCLIRQGVSIGRAANHGSGPSAAGPVLGNRVEIGANAVLIGGITVGDDVVIGPCTVVMRDVPSGSVVVSQPGRIMTQPPRRKDVAQEA